MESSVKTGKKWRRNKLGYRNKRNKISDIILSTTYLKDVTW